MNQTVCQQAICRDPGSSLTTSVNSQLVETPALKARPQFLEDSIRESIGFNGEVQRTLKRMGIKWKLEKIPELEIRVGLSACIYAFNFSPRPTVFIDVNMQVRVCGVSPKKIIFPVHKLFYFDHFLPAGHHLYSIPCLVFLTLFIIYFWLPFFNTTLQLSNFSSVY